MIVIDGYWIKNVVLRNATIAYHGGPVRLENVYFVDCRFGFSQLPRTRSLVDHLLASLSVTFETANS